jgi:hypothetical protein
MPETTAAPRKRMSRRQAIAFGIGMTLLLVAVGLAIGTDLISSLFVALLIGPFGARAAYTGRGKTGGN